MDGEDIPETPGKHNMEPDSGISTGLVQRLVQSDEK
jgi:hypothetical protein